MPGVFISYRRDDSSGVTGRLFDYLSAEFGRTNIYMDLDTIAAGDDFASVIVQKIGVSDVLLAVIGDRWLTASEANGKRRLDNPQDFVRIEIAKALARGMRVIPVLVSAATMPLAADLPEDLRPLCQRQAMELRDSHFHQDAQQLINVLHSDLHGRPLVKADLKRFAPALLIGTLVIILGVVLLLSRQPKLAAHTDPTPVPKEVIATNREPIPAALPVAQPPASLPRLPVNVAGKWQATVKYDWGDTYNENFEFEVDGQELSGMAGFLGDREGDGRAIVEGKIAGNRINFVTRTGNVGSDDKDTHTYKGIVEGNEIRFTMLTDSKSSEHAPIHFIAKRAEKK